MQGLVNDKSGPLSSFGKQSAFIVSIISCLASIYIFYRETDEYRRMLFLYLVNHPLSEQGGVVGIESERQGCHNVKTVDIGMVAIWKSDV